MYVYLFLSVFICLSSFKTAIATSAYDTSISRVVGYQDNMSNWKIFTSLLYILEMND